MSMDGYMELKKVKISEIKPYAGNPRKNKAAVDAVAESIKQCDYIAPIIVDENMEVLAGHTRLKALKKLGRKNVEIVVKAGLTEEQKRKYRLLDNKTNELAEWDIPQLAIELEGLDFEGLDIDWGIPDIEVEEDYPDDGYYGDERERTFNSTNFNDYDENRVEGFYEMPTLEPVDHVPSKLIGFNYAKTSKEFDAGIHFYLDDYQFERLWNRPYEYMELLSQFDCVLTPNFSIYLDMPQALKIWNTYRARLLGQMMQDNGLTVIPIVYWSDERSYGYCFDGLPVCGTLSVNNIGNGVPEAKAIWDKGMDELIRRKRPKRILLYGNGAKEDYDFGDIEVVYYENSVTKRMKGTEDV